MSVIVSASDFIGSLGGILAGLSELLLAVGAGLGFVIKSRRNARRERLRTETAASLAAREAQRQLETRLADQHTAQLEQYRQQIMDINKRYEDQIDDLQKAHDLQVEQFKQQVRDLTHDREALLSRLLNGSSKKESRDD